MSEENIYTFENKDYRSTYWHTCSHVLAQAAQIMQGVNHFYMMMHTSPPLLSLTIFCIVS